MASEAHPTPLENLVREAAFKLKRADEYRTSASILLAECKQRVETGDPEVQGLAWTEYCRVHLSPYTPNYLDQLILAGAQPNDPDDPVDAPAQQDLLDRAWAAFVALDLERQREFLRCGAAHAIHPEEARTHPGLDAHPGPSNALDWLA